MKKDDQRGIGRSLEVIEDDLVAIRRRKDLPVGHDQPAGPGQTSPDCLQVRAREPPGGKENIFALVHASGIVF